MSGQACDNSHMLAVALGDLVSDGVLIGQVLIVEQVLPALGLIEVSDLGWRRAERERGGGEEGRREFNI